MLSSRVKLVKTAAVVLVAIAVGGGVFAQETKPSNPAGVRRSQSEGGREGDKIVVTAAETMDVVVSQRYACQLRASRYLEVRVPQKGSLGSFKIREGQTVKKGELLFEVEPLVTRNTPSRDTKPTDQKVNSVKVVAPFDGIADRVKESGGTLVDEGDVLMSMGDTSLMWAYFHVPETRYLDYMAAKAQGRVDPKIGLELGEAGKFKQSGEIGAILAASDDKIGNIKFRADFANPDRLLRHGQTGTAVMRQTLRGATVIPKRSAYEILDKRNVYVVDQDNVVHRREIAVENETDDVLMIKKGIRAGERIVLDWDQPLFVGRKIEYQFRPLNAVIGQSKDHKAEK